MIKLHRFRGEGAFTYDSWDLNLADQGIVFMRGENLDAGGSNGSGKCVVGDTLIPTTTGLKRIDQLVDHSKPEGFQPLNITLATRTGVDSTKRGFHECVPETILIQTCHGFSVEGTPEHKVLVMTSDGIRFKELRHLSDTDYVAVSPESELWSNTDVSLSGFVSDHDTSASILTCPSRMTKSLAWVMGALVANGAIYDSDASCVDLISIDTDLRREFCSRVYEVFGYSPHEEQTYVRIFSSFIKQFFAFAGLRTSRSFDKEVPWSVLSSKRNTVLAFLRGYLSFDSETEGGLPLLTTVSPSLAKNFHQILLNLGVVSSLEFKQFVDPYSRHSLCSSSTSDGRGLKEEAIRIRSHLSSSSAATNPENEGYWRIEVRSEYLDKFQRLFGHQRVECPLGGTDENTQKFFWDRIVSRDRSYEMKFVYDFNVSKDNPTFIGNGIVNHNSTPFEVLEHLLFGKTSKGLKKNSIISMNPSADEGFFAELTLEKDGTFWLIRESRGHKHYGTKLKLFEYVDGDWEDRTPKNNPGRDDARKFITDNLVPLTVSEFHGCVYLAQRATHVLVNGTPGERSAYLSSLFGLDRYDELKTETDSDLKVVTEELSSMQSVEDQITGLYKQLEDLPSDEEIVNKQEILQQARTHGDKILSEAEERKTKAIRLIDNINRRNDLLTQALEFGYGDDLRFVSSELEKTDIKISTIQEEEIDPIKKVLNDRERYESLTEQLSRIGEPNRSSSSIQEDIEKLAAEREYLKSLIPKFEEKSRLEERLSSLEGLSAVHEDQESTQLELERLQNERIRYKEIITRCQDEMPDIDTDSPTCPTCGQDIDQNHIKKVIGDLRDEMADAKNNDILAKRRIPELKDILDQVGEYRNVLDSLNELPDLPDVDIGNEVLNAREKLKEAKAELASIQEYEKIKAELANIEVPDKDINLLQTELSSLKVNLEELKAKRDNLMSVKHLLDQVYAIDDFDLEPVKYDYYIAEEILSDVKDARMEVEAKWAVLDEQSRSRSKCIGEIERLNNRIRNIQDVRQKHRLLQCLSKAVPKLKRRQLRQIVSAIHDVLPKYASVMFSERPPVNFVVKDDEDSIDIMMERTVYDKDTGTSTKVHIPINAISGGEQKRTSVSLLFTLHDVLASEKRVDFLVLDEVDSGLDGLGVDALMRIVDHCKRSYGTVIMTSHRPQISGSVFDQAWTVRKENNVSTIHTEV